MAAARRMPAAAVAGLDDEGRAKARAWWKRLSPRAREEFIALWDERSEETSLAGEVQSDGSVVWHAVPLEVRGLIVEGRKSSRRSRRWNADHYEYLVNHPEAVMVLAGRSLHVCRAHPAARAVLKRGVLEGCFDCPLGRGDCPMTKLLEVSRGRRIEFTT
jgi:hypothetical protein